VGQYGAAAILATQLYPKAKPPDSWDLAIAQLTASTESARKDAHEANILVYVKLA
jgi:hypothetical protein